MRLRKPKRKHLIIIAIIILIAFILSFFAHEYISNLYVGYTMDEIEAPGKNDRVLIFAPHNDDEALGAAHLIKVSIQNGASVKVVLATNGDGFTRAVAIESISINPKPKDFIKYGYTRQQESIRALKLLGVKEEDIVFLGYPDTGLSRMWTYNWTNNTPYKSSHTKTDKSPYNNSYSNETLYTGENLYNDIVELIKDYKPTYVVYPHTNDKHPDHWALNAFVKYSMTCINYKPDHELEYLVHRGGWPTPLKRDRNMFLVPPMSLLNTGTKWLSLSMSEEDIEEKAGVFRQYKSQIKRISMLMSAFERRNELFGEYDNAKLAMNERDDSDIAPNADNVIIEDPSKDALNLEVSSGSDIISINAEVSKQNNLHTFIVLNNKPDKIVTYYLNMIFIKDGRCVPLRLIINNKSLRLAKQRETSITDISGIKLVKYGRIIHITIPENELGAYDNVFMNVETSVNSYYMDRTAWRMVDK